MQTKDYLEELFINRRKESFYASAFSNKTWTENGKNFPVYIFYPDNLDAILHQVEKGRKSLIVTGKYLPTGLEIGYRAIFRLVYDDHKRYWFTTWIGYYPENIENGGFMVVRVTEKDINAFCESLLIDLESVDFKIIEARIQQCIGVNKLVGQNEELNKALKSLYSKKKTLLFGYSESEKEKIPA